VLPAAEHIHTELDLSSVYVTVTGSEPAFTNYTQGFTGVLDYLWYTSESLRPLAVAPVPDEDQLREVGGALPNCLYSSDHLLLCADMQLIGTEDPTPAMSGGANTQAPVLNAFGQPVPGLAPQTSKTLRRGS